MSTFAKVIVAALLLVCDKVLDQLAGSSMVANAELLRGHKDELANGLATSVLGF